MPTYTVKSAAKKKDVPDAKFGPAQVIALTLSNGDGEKEAEWFTKATTALPEPGQTLEGDVTQGNYGLQFKKAQGGGFGGGGAKDAYWQAKEQRDIEGIARMGRAHAQEMALQWLRLCGVTPPNADDRGELVAVIDWFQHDVDNATGADGSGSPVHGAGSAAPAAAVSATGFASPKQKTFFERLLKEAGGKPETVNAIVLYAENGLARNLVSEAIDGLKDEATQRATALVLAQDANEWAAKQPSDIPHDDTPAPETEAMADDPSVKF